MKKSSRPPSALLATLFLLPLLAAQAVPPAPPSNVRAVDLPAEVLLTWNASAGADFYQVYRAAPGGVWVPVATQLTVPRFRDTDFLSLPCYYQISACTAAGECSGTPALTVNPATAAISLIGAKTRPLSDTSVAIWWTIQGPGGGDAQLEIGPSPSSLQLVGVRATLAARHEFAVVNLAPNSTYFYRLTSVGANGAGFTYTDQVTTRPFTAPPPVVVRLSDPFPALVTDEDTPVNFTLTANSPNGRPLTFSMPIVTIGTVVGTPPNLTYIPGPERTDPDFMQCTYTDGFFPLFAPVLVTINPVVDMPIALDRSVTVTEDVGGRFTVQATAWDSNPANVDCLVVDGPTNGTLTKVPLEKMSLQYIPNTNFNGVDHFTFRCFDGQRVGNAATVRLRVEPVNDTPVANSQTVTVLRNTSLTITLDSSDPDGDPLTCVVQGGPSHGTLSGPTPNLTGQVTYTPAAGYFGPDSFTWQVTDPAGAAASATVSIDVLRGNLAPTANSAAVSTESGVPVTVQLTGSDPDGDPLSFSIVTAPAHGALSGVMPNVVYTPAAGFSGMDGFSFKANDGQADSGAATVSIEVVRGNVAPTANAMSVVTAFGVPVIVVLAGSDADGDALTCSVLTLPSHGTLSGVAPNLAYTPAAGYSGADGFTFKVNDGRADSAPAAVSVEVLRGNVAPTADAMSVATGYGVPVNVVLAGSDADGDALTFSVLTLPSHGTLSGVAPNLVYTPAAGYSGPDSFMFKVNDGRADSAPASVTVQVGPMHEPPCAVTSLQAVGVSRSHIKLAWIDQCGVETGFVIERAKQDQTKHDWKWEQIGTVPANACAYTDTTLLGSRTYYYRVIAVNGPARSACSNVAEARTH